MTRKWHEKKNGKSETRTICVWVLRAKFYWTIGSNISDAHFNEIEWGIRLFMRTLRMYRMKDLLEIERKFPFFAFHWNSLTTNELMWTRAGCRHLISLILQQWWCPNENTLSCTDLWHIAFSTNTQQQKTELIVLRWSECRNLLAIANWLRKSVRLSIHPMAKKMVRCFRTYCHQRIIVPQ